MAESKYLLMVSVAGSTEREEFALPPIFGRLIGIAKNRPKLRM